MGAYSALNFSVKKGNFVCTHIMTSVHNKSVDLYSTYITVHVFQGIDQLLTMIVYSPCRVPITTLMRCGEALDKMFNSDQSSRESHPSLSDPATPQTISHTEPVVPQPKLMEPQHSPSLLEFKRVPSPPANYESLLGAIHTRPLPPERLPPSKRMCNRGVIISCMTEFVLLYNLMTLWEPLI